MKQPTCIYDKERIATDSCDLCLNPLCSFCGYIVDNFRLCNSCYSEAVCQICEEMLEPMYENTGFNEIGAEHNELTGYKKHHHGDEE